MLSAKCFCMILTTWMTPLSLPVIKQCTSFPLPLHHICLFPIHITPSQFLSHPTSFFILFYISLFRLLNSLGFLLRLTHTHTHTDSAAGGVDCALSSTGLPTRPLSLASEDGSVPHYTESFCVTLFVSVFPVCVLLCLGDFPRTSFTQDLKITLLDQASSFLACQTVPSSPGRKQRTFASHVINIISSSKLAKDLCADFHFVRDISSCTLLHVS